ncbi:MAG: amidohydrolase family protein [Hyphomicrobiales bacterium]|nr:amidohydrolase family protein [Hyphomicrobiales bacterium]
MTDPAIPRLTAPPGACDTHFHIYEPQYPLAATAALPAPPAATFADYARVRARLGIERTVVVQPTAYGADNRCTMAAVAAFGPSSRAVVVVDPSVGDAELADLTARGARGIRFFFLPGGALPFEVLDEMAARVRDHGWHVQMQLDGNLLPDYEAAFARLPGGLVIDHVGRFHGGVAPDSPAFKSLLRLVEGGDCWVKLSAPYMSTPEAGPGYPAVTACARDLVKTAPERMVWASNWPHPGVEPRPDDGPLLDLLLAWADDDATRRRILVDNPAVLYGF